MTAVSVPRHDERTSAMMQQHHATVLHQQQALQREWRMDPQPGRAAPPVPQPAPEAQPADARGAEVAMGPRRHFPASPSFSVGMLQIK